jgi:molecular chaperone DnaJ
MPDPHGGPAGDLHIQIQVEVPKKLHPRQEQLLRELADLERTEVTPHRKSFFESLKEYFGLEDDADGK